MNTTGIQNYLSNVFRPIYTYDSATSNFTPKLELSNVDTYSGNIVSVIRGDIGDARSNVYVGLLSGNSIIDTRACSNISAFGYAAGNTISNCSNSVYIGTEAGQASSNNQGVISIGYQSGKAGLGVSNIFIGTGTNTIVGSSNIFLGHGINLSNVSNQIRIGLGTQIPIAADLSRNWVGLGGILSPTDVNIKLDVSGNTRIQGNLDISGNIRASDSSGATLDFSNGFTRSSGGFLSSNGTISGTGGANTPIGTLKKGLIFVSVQDVASTTNHFASSMVYCSDPTDGTYVWDMSGSYIQQGDVTLNYNSSNIRFSNAGSTRNFLWSITYLPVA